MFVQKIKMESQHKMCKSSALAPPVLIAVIDSWARAPCLGREGRKKCSLTVLGSLAGSEIQLAKTN